VTINDYRLNSGASSVALVHEGSMRVVVVGIRSATLADPPISNPGVPGFGTDDVADFYGPNDTQVQYLDKGTGQITLSTILNSQGSIAPNQTITMTFTMPTPGTLLIVTWLSQSILRIDGSTLTLLASSAPTAANMIANGDGESGTLGVAEPSWTNLGGNALITANDFVHGGAKSMKVNNAVANDSFSYQDFSVTDAQVYVVQGWIKTSGLGNNAGRYALLNVVTISGVTSYNIISKTTIGADPISTTPSCGLPADGTDRAFTFVQCVFRVNGSGTMRVYCQLGFGGNVPGTAWFDDVLLAPAACKAYTVSNSTSYYLYPYIEVSSGLLKFANGTPPPTSPSDTFSQQAVFDGRIGVPPKKVITPAAGSSGSDTGGGDGTCPEFNEPVTIRRYSDDGDLLFQGVVPAKEVTTGYESDDGLIKRGCFILGWSFSKLKYVWRAVHRTRQVHCAGWVMVKGYRLTPCEAVWWEDGWFPAWKTPGAVHDDLISIKMDIEVEADWDDEHNYCLGENHDMIIHNTFILPC
jgi:hypothetical protein